MLTAANALVQFLVLVFGGVFFSKYLEPCADEREKRRRVLLWLRCVGRHAEWVFGLWKRHQREISR
jgi:hypothetical protein